MTARSSAIAFDLDDTLYPERTYVLSGFQAVANWAEQALGIPAQVGLGRLSDLFQAGVRGDTFNRWLRGYALPEQPWLEDMIKVYRDHRPNLAPYPDVIPCLKALQNECTLGIITEGVQRVQEMKLQALRLPVPFASVIITDITERDHWKPSVVPFQRFLLDVGIPATHTWYIGDNPRKDFRGARKLGISTVRLRRDDGLHREQEPLELADRPDCEIHSLSELSEIIHNRDWEV